jgi:hypothetical protein
VRYTCVQDLSEGSLEPLLCCVSGRLRQTLRRYKVAPLFPIAKSAGAVVRAANANGKDVTAAAAQLHTPLTDHVTVAERATEAVDRIDCTLNAARLRGDLAFLNSAYPKSDLRFQDRALGTFGHSSNCMHRSDAQYREYFSCPRYALFALA